MAVLLILAGIVVPMAGDSGTTRLRQAANLVAADLAFAQVDSITHSDDPRLFVLDAQANSYYLAAASDPEVPLTNPVGKQPYEVIFGQGRAAAMQGVTITDFDLGPDDDVELQFGQYGQLDQTTAATITLSAGGKSITLTIDPVTGETAIGDIE